MRIESVTLSAFGPFSDVTLDFDRSKGLQMVLGSNEAGKSTALRAIQAALFGIPRNSRDKGVHQNQTAVRMALCNGSRQLTFERRKGQKTSLRDVSSNKPLPEDVLQPFTGALDEATFSAMFGITHAQLVAGGRDLVTGQGQAAAALFAAASGLSGINQLLKEIGKQREEIFRQRAQSPRLNDAFRRYQQKQSEVTQHSVRVNDWKAAREQVARFEEELNALRGRERALDKQIAETEKLLKAQPVLLAWQAVRAELERLQDARLLPEDFGERLRNAQEKRSTAESRLAGVTHTLTQLETEAKPLEVQRQILDHAEAIEALAADVRNRTTALRDLETSIRPKLAASNAQLEALGADAAALARAESPLPEQAVEHLHALVPEASRLRAAVETAQAEARRLEARVKEEAAALSQIQAPRDVAPLRALVRRLGQSPAEAAEAEELRETLAAREAELNVRLGRLIGDAGQWSRLEPVELPSAVALDGFRERFQALSNEEAQEQRALEAAQGRRDEARRELEVLRGQGELPDTEALQEARARRQVAWIGLRGWLLGRDLPPPTEVNASTARFEEHMASADGVADALRAEAERVERAQQIQRRLDDADADAAARAAALQGLAEARVALQGEYETLWSRWPISVQPPGEMERVLRQLEECREESASLRRERAALAVLDTKVTAARRELAAALAELGLTVDADATLARLHEQLEAKVNALADAASRREQREVDLARLEEQALPEQRALARRAQDELDRWKTAWRSVMTQLELPETLSPAEAQRAVNRQTELARVLTSRAESAERQAEVCAFDAAVQQQARSLAVLLAPETTEQDAAEIAAGLSQRLSEERRKAEELAKVVGRQETEERTRATLHAELQQAQAQIAACLREAMVEDEEALPGAEAASRARRNLESELRGHEQQLALLGGEAWRERLAAAGEQARESLEDALRDAQHEAEELQQARAAAERRAVESRCAFDALDKQGAAAEASIVAAGIAEEIVSEAEHYLQLRAAEHLLTRAMERYREEHQDPVLRHASSYFARMTGGSFSGAQVEYSDAAAQILVGVRPSGGYLTVEQMSDGAADQLYLALRLATWQHYFDQHPPVPIILDDVLINFDDARAAAALQILAELSERTQVIFFTHHQHLTEIARSAVATSCLHIQELGPTATAPAR